MVSPVLFSLCVNDMPVPSIHVELALYADDAAVIATTRKPVLLVSYLEAYLADLELGEVLHSQAYPESPSSLSVRGTNRVGRYSMLSGRDL